MKKFIETLKIMSGIVLLLFGAFWLEYVDPEKLEFRYQIAFNKKDTTKADLTITAYTVYKGTGGTGPIGYDYIGHKTRYAITFDKINPEDVDFYKRFYEDLFTERWEQKLKQDEEHYQREKKLKKSIGNWRIF